MVWVMSRARKGGMPALLPLAAAGGGGHLRGRARVARGRRRQPLVDVVAQPEACADVPVLGVGDGGGGQLHPRHVDVAAPVPGVGGGAAPAQAGGVAGRLRPLPHEVVLAARRKAHGPHEGDAGPEAVAGQPGWVRERGVGHQRAEQRVHGRARRAQGAAAQRGEQGGEAGGGAGRGPVPPPGCEVRVVAEGQPGPRQQGAGVEDVAQIGERGREL